MNNHDDDSQFDGPGLHRGQSIALMDKADEFVTQHSRRERAILINIAIDQGKTVGELLKTISEMNSINFVGKVHIGMQEIELTKTLIYVQKDARK